MKINREISWLAAVGATVSVQGGASLAKFLFPVVGAAGATFLRVGLAAVLMLLVFRPKVHRLFREQRRRIVLYGLSIALMNLVFYYALQRTPLGIAVMVEFVGPLSLAFVFSRKPVDYLWTALAVTGILLIVPWTQGNGDLPISGILLAAAAGAGWALYILATNHVTKVTRANDAAALGMSVATLAVLPIALLDGGIFAFRRDIILASLGTAVFSSALPFTLELIALKGLSKKTFSITISIEPAVAALCGFLFLHETLTALQLFAMACVITASIGSTLTAGTESANS